jgi:hypothetical protein
LQEYVIAAAEEKISISTALYESLGKLLVDKKIGKLEGTT